MSPRNPGVDGLDVGFMLWGVGTWSPNWGPEVKGSVSAVRVAVQSSQGCREPRGVRGAGRLAFRKFEAVCGDLGSSGKRGYGIYGGWPG